MKSEIKIRHRSDGTGCRKNRILILAVFAMFLLGCAGSPPSLVLTDIDRSFPPDTLIRTKDVKAIDFEELIQELSQSRIIYVGERHTSPQHHEIQRKIAAALFQIQPDLSVGMEMFDITYQPVLDLWSKGDMDEEQFLRKVHWYANWRYNYALYRPIMELIRTRNIRLVALNIPFSIPPKIAVGGLENLGADERRFLPEHIDFSDKSHREYLKTVYEGHKIRGRDRFEDFYAAQCVWEEAMAASVASGVKEGLMVVLAGNGHILKKFGIPNRAYRRNRLPFSTLYLALPGEKIELNYADYIWVTSPQIKGSQGPRIHGSK